MHRDSQQLPLTVSSQEAEARKQAEDDAAEKRRVEQVAVALVCGLKVDRCAICRWQCLRKSSRRYQLGLHACACLMCTPCYYRKQRHSQSRRLRRFTVDMLDHPIHHLFAAGTSSCVESQLAWEEGSICR